MIPSFLIFHSHNPILDECTPEEWALWRAVIDDLDEVYQDDEEIPYV